MSYLPCIEIEPTNNANSAIIWLHGLGASGDDFAPIVPQLKLDSSIAMRFIFPHAPSRAITINGGAAMPAWYDFVINGVDREVNKDDLKVTTQQILDLVQRELDRGIPSDRILLAGFSQGGAIAYQVAMSWNQMGSNGSEEGKSLAGLMAMSTYIAEEAVVVESRVVKGFPIHIFHGTQDQVVPESLGLSAKDLLEANGFAPKYSVYTMEHSVCISQIRDIASFINECLSN